MPGDCPLGKNDEGASAGDEDVDRGVDLKLPDSPQRRDGTGGQLANGIPPDGDDILLRDEAEDVENEAVLLKDDEEDVLPPDDLARGADRPLGQNGRPLLGELDEKDLPRRPGRQGAERPCQAGSG